MAPPSRFPAISITIGPASSRISGRGSTIRRPRLKPYEALARAIGYQQLTAKAGDAIIARLKALYPTPLFRRLRTSWSPELLARVATINGMGRWTVEMLLMYSLERMHILPADDFGVREGYRSLKSLPEQPEPNALREIGKAWAPHRTVTDLDVRVPCKRIMSLPSGISRRSLKEECLQATAASSTTR